MKSKHWIYQDEVNADGGNGDGVSTADTLTVDTSATNTDAKATNVDAKTATTVVDKETVKEVKPIWPEDWRKQLAGEDEKTLKQLGRYASPKDIWEKARALEQRLSSGELKSTLPKDAKPEEVAQWRKENGIPETPDKYELKLDGNLVIGEEDKPMVDEFLKAAHANNMTPTQAKAAVQSYFEIQAKNAEARVAKDDTERLATLDALNAEWGNGFRTNINMVGGVLSRFPASVQDAIKNARLPDGTALFNNPDVLRGFVAMALEINPAGTLVPSGTGDVAKGINEQIAEIEKIMKTDRKSYNKDEKMQANYRELIGAREKLNERKAA